MTHLRYRSALPLGNTVVDLLVLAIWIWQGSEMSKYEKSFSASPSLVTTVALLQETGGWDPRTNCDSHGPDILISGTLPAGIVAIYLRPEGSEQRRGHLWDPLWLLIHEAIAIPFWFLLGIWIDAGHPLTAKVMRYYLAARCGFGIAGAIGVAEVGTRLQVVFWLGLTGCAIVSGVLRVARVVSSRT